MAVNGLYTTVKNTSGSERVFGFLGTHGKRLANNETYTVRGDLVATLGAKKSSRQFKALEKCLEDGDLVLSSPALYLNEADSYYQVSVSEDGVALGSPVGWD